MAKDMNAGPPVTPEYPPVKEEWWELPLVNARVAAFHAGCLLNQLHWVLQIRVLFHPRRHDEVDEVFAQLVTATYTLLGTGTNSIEKDLRRVQHAAQRDYSTEEFAEAVDHFRFPEDDSDEDISESDFCRRLVVEYVTPRIERIRRTWREDLSPELFDCLQLGESLDQAIRRPDVFRFVSQEPERAVEASPDASVANAGHVTYEEETEVEAEEFDPKALGWRRLPKGGWQRPREYAIYRPTPGEYAPEDSWHGKIVVAARRADMPNNIIELLDSSVIKQLQVFARVRVLRTRIRDVLTNPKRQSLHPRWNDDERTLSYDGQIVKKYGRHPATTQIAVLQAFHEEGWPESIDIPNNTMDFISVVKNFNNCRDLPLIRLRATEGGKGVGWAVEPQHDETP